MGPIATLVTRAQSWIDREVGACDIALEVGKAHGLSAERRLEMLHAAAEVVGMDAWLMGDGLRPYNKVIRASAGMTLEQLEEMARECA